ncbi:MAG: HEPN domain-containing protein [bacterium]
MKEAKDSLYPPDWIKKAQMDWNRMERMLEDEDPEGASFFLQQSLEKYIKAFLLGKGWKLKKIHEIDSLLDDVVKYNQNLEPFRALCERVSGYLQRTLSRVSRRRIDLRGCKKRY